MRSDSRLAVLGLSLALAALSGCGGPVASIAGGGSTASLAAAALPAPSVEPYPSPNYNQRPAGMPIDTLLLHHTASRADALATARYFANPASQVSAHYIVDRDGSIIQCVPDAERAWHAGASIFDGRPDVNNYSIGIEICNVGDDIEPYPNAQVQATIRLAAYLMQKYGIPLSRITRHRDVCVPPGRKTDTSLNFPLAYFKTGVQDLLEGKPIPPRVEPAPPAGYDDRIRLYTVKRGDTWSSIADGLLDNPLRASDLAMANSGTMLVPGATIRLPTDYKGFFQLHPMPQAADFGLLSAAS